MYQAEDYWEKALLLKQGWKNLNNKSNVFLYKYLVDLEINSKESLQAKSENAFLLHGNMDATLN